jgi:mercuric ion transport protein
VTGTTEGFTEATARREDAAGFADGTRRQRLVATGGVLGAVAASSCCIVPLLLFSVGAGGVWIGNLTSLAPYQPIFLAVTAGFLGYGYFLVYRKPKPACDADAACAAAVSNRVVKGALWAASVLAIAALAFPWYAPLLLDY